jgi:hypothetical protein
MTKLRLKTIAKLFGVSTVILTGPRRSRPKWHTTILTVVRVNKERARIVIRHSGRASCVRARRRAGTVRIQRMMIGRPG